MEFVVPVWRDPDAAAAALARGRVVLLPTDTLPGLHARADRPAAVARIAILKRRPPDRPYLRLASGVDAALALAALDGSSRRDRRRLDYARRCWPGPFTLVLPVRTAAGRVPRQTTVAVRVPEPPSLRRLVAAAGGPVVSTSANRHGEPAPRDLAAARRLWGTRVDGIWDPQGSGGAGEEEAGRPEAGHASTLVDLTSWPPRVLRAGDRPPPPWDDIA